MGMLSVLLLPQKIQKALSDAFSRDAVQFIRQDDRLVRDLTQHLNQEGGASLAKVQDQLSLHRQSPGSCRSDDRHGIGIFAGEHKVRTNQISTNKSVDDQDIAVFIDVLHHDLSIQDQLHGFAAFVLHVKDLILLIFPQLRPGIAKK